MAMASSLRVPPLTLKPIPNPNSHNKKFVCAVRKSYSSPSAVKVKYAILGAGFAGLSVAWHLLQHFPKESHVCMDIFDEAGVGGGASGSSGGLLHPYSPKAKALWRGADCWKECLNLLTVAQKAVHAHGMDNIDSLCDCNGPIILRRGILKPVTSEKNLGILKENAQNCLQSCNLEVLNGDGAQCLVPNLRVPFDSAIYMPHAMNVHPERYLHALFSACQNAADETSTTYGEKRLNLHKQSIDNLDMLGDEYTGVIVCLGAKSSLLPELLGKLPLRTCRGVISQLQLPERSISESHKINGPSILSDAWLAFQGTQSVLMGSTWDWNSLNYSSTVTNEESNNAYEELLPKASQVYPSIRDWELIGARAGLRAMPPFTPLGSLPILGCIDKYVNVKNKCKYWLFSGLGARGLLYHGLLGRLMAEAVFSFDENVLPSELTSWMKKSKKD